MGELSISLVRPLLRRSPAPIHPAGGERESVKFIQSRSLSKLARWSADAHIRELLCFKRPPRGCRHPRSTLDPTWPLAQQALTILHSASTDLALTGMANSITLSSIER